MPGKRYRRPALWGTGGKTGNSKGGITQVVIIRVRRMYEKAGGGRQLEYRGAPPGTGGNWRENT